MASSFLHKRRKFRNQAENKPYLLPFLQLKEVNISLTWLRWLGYFMAFSGGMINAIGFFSFNKYTSHMSGQLANVSGDIFLGNWTLALTALLSICSFILGSAHSSWTILWSKKHRYRSTYALSMWIEAVYLIIFGLIGRKLYTFSDFSILFFLMCFIMGMHNGILTILSQGMIRTTHMTGHVTDIGIEFSKFIYNIIYKKDASKIIETNPPRIKLLLGIVLSFVAGGIIGTWGFFQLGYKIVLPIAIYLLLLGSTSIRYDVKVRSRLHRYQHYLQKKKESIKTV